MSTPEQRQPLTIAQLLSDATHRDSVTSPTLTIAQLLTDATVGLRDVTNANDATIDRCSRI